MLARALRQAAPHGVDHSRRWHTTQRITLDEGDYLLEAGARMSDTALLLTTERPGAVDVPRALRIGATMVGERLWDLTGCRRAIGVTFAA